MQKLMKMFKMFHAIQRESPFTVLHALILTVVQKREREGGGGEVREKLEAEPLQTLLKCHPSNLNQAS
jgi:hypothetical protein